MSKDLLSTIALLIGIVVFFVGMIIANDFLFIFGATSAFVSFLYLYIMDKDKGKENDNQQKNKEEIDYRTYILYLLADVMSADLKLMNCELDKVKSTICRYYKTEAEQKIALVKFHAILKNPQRNAFGICKYINQHYVYATKVEILMELLAVAYADGDNSVWEEMTIWNIAQNLEFTKEQYNGIKSIFFQKYKHGFYNEHHSEEDAHRRRYSNENEDSRKKQSYSSDNRGSDKISLQEKEAYSILGIDANVSDAEVKKAYRAMAVKFHPDNAAKLGDEAIRQATETMKQINEAWETVKMARGIK